MPGGGGIRTRVPWAVRTLHRAGRRRVPRRPDCARKVRRRHRIVVIRASNRAGTAAAGSQSGRRSGGSPASNCTGRRESPRQPGAGRERRPLRAGRAWAEGRVQLPMRRPPAADHRQEQQPCRQRAVSLDHLQRERQEQEGAEDRDSGDADSDIGAATGAVEDHAQRQQRVTDAPLGEDEPGEQHHAADQRAEGQRPSTRRSRRGRTRTRSRTARCRPARRRASLFAGPAGRRRRGPGEKPVTRSW